jgi:hypothetical protein
VAVKSPSHLRSGTYSLGRRKDTYGALVAAFSNRCSCKNPAIFYSDNQAIRAVKAAVAKPKNPKFPLIECEFPPLASLNKLGDGSMRSSNLVDDVSTARRSEVLPLAGDMVCSCQQINRRAHIIASYSL